MKKYRLFLALLAAVISLLLFAVFRFPLFYAYVIHPIAQIMWFVYRLFLMIDQQVYWVILIFASVGFLLRGLFGRSEDELPVSKYQLSAISYGGVEYWKKLYRNASRSADSLKRLESSLAMLEHSIAQLSERGTAGEDEIPEFSLGGGNFAKPPGLMEKIAAQIPGYRTRREKLILDEANKAIGSMESRLEINHEKNKR